VLLEFQLSAAGPLLLLGQQIHLVGTEMETELQLVLPFDLGRVIVQNA